MLKCNLLRKNNGFLLISTYIAIVLLLIFGAALFSRSADEHKFASISQDNLAARYAAEQGIDYVISEIKYNGQLHTHNADSDNVLQVETDNPLETGDLKMGSNVLIDGAGNYSSNFPNEESQFQVKVYSDPINEDETIILSRGINGSETRLIVSKYVPSSLYQFFIFTPYQFWPGSNELDAGGATIHANDWIVFNGSADFSNLTGMSTAKYFRHDAKGFVPPGEISYDHDNNPSTPDETKAWDEIFWNWRDPYVTPNDTDITEAKYRNKYDGLNYGDLRGLRMFDAFGSVVAWDGVSEYLDPYETANFEHYRWDAYLTTINGVDIPNKFANTGYDWNKYYQFGTSGVWYDGRRWNHSPEIITAHHFNTDEQYSDWDNFLSAGELGETLNGVLKDANTGGFHYEPLTIDGAQYQDSAQYGGIYINEDVSGTLNVYLNSNTPLSWDGNQIDINGETAVFEKKSFVDINSTFTRNVITLDIEKLKIAKGDTNAGLSQNIIYSNYPLVLTNATDILSGGLTTICEENLYLHGNYNDVSGKPSAAIGAKYIYTLSSDWDYPQTLEAPYNNPNHPYEHNFYCPHGDETCRTYLIDKGRDADEVTHDNYSLGRNWYFENEANMANEVDNTAQHIYKVALVGYYGGNSPYVLERWTHYDNPGSLTELPSSWVGASREIHGAFIRLKLGDFPYSGDRDYNRQRCCSAYSAPCRDCTLYPNGWVTTAYGPGGSRNSYFYDTQFSGGDVPPGDYFAYSSSAFLEIEDNATNWNNHHIPISMPSP